MVSFIGQAQIKPRNLLLDLAQLNQGIDSIGQAKRYQQQTERQDQQQTIDNSRQNRLLDLQEQKARAAAAQAAAAPAAKMEAENRAFERQKELIRYKSQFGDGGGSFGKNGTIVQGPNGQFFSIQFGSNGTRRILPLTFEEAQAEGMLGDGWQGVRNSEQKAQPSQAVPLSPAKGVAEVDTGTGTLLIDKATGQPISTVQKDLAGAEDQKVTGRETAEGRLALPKIERGLAMYNIKSRVVDGYIDKALELAGDFGTTGFVGGMTNTIPGSPAFRLARALDPIKANLGFDELQNMRDNSPTGGALGQVAVQELAMLQAVMGSIDQAQQPQDIIDALQTIKQVRAEFRALKQKAYEQDVARFGAGNVPNPQTGQSGTGSDSQEQPQTFVYDPATGELRPK